MQTPTSSNAWRDCSARDTDPMRVERVVVGMSGGVDSSVAAALLVDAGHDVVGVTMRVWAGPDVAEQTSRFGACCGSEAVDDARRVATTLRIPYYLLNMADEFDRAVIGPFADSYRRGRTPVPCVACNVDLKFGSLLARARAWDAAAVATGHYARVTRDPDGRWVLRRARDLRKDQSDFLWPLTQSQLAAARFPVGELTKDDVRAHARRLGLATADKPESQEICFVPEGDYRGYLRARDPGVFRPGAIVDLEGHRLGGHAGVAGFTIGQRKGLGLAGRRTLYVVDLDPETDQVVVGAAADLERDELEVSRTNFIGGALPVGPIRVTARIRHNHEPAAASVHVLGQGRARVVFDTPQRAITPGQSCVWYRGDEVVGGGVIERASGLTPDRVG
jgi:tRNA-specific 2-thiouridylase